MITESHNLSSLREHPNPTKVMKRQLPLQLRNHSPGNYLRPFIRVPAPLIVHGQITRVLVAPILSLLLLARSGWVGTDFPLALLPTPEG